MLADVDELKQRLDRPENQSRLAEQRRQLEQTRDELQRAAEAAGDGSVAQAVASGTRAQRQLQSMKDELRKRNSSQFSDDLREMRGEARELARQQEDIAKKLEGLQDPAHRTLSDAPEKEALAQALAQQKDRMKQLVDRATHVSEQAESSEPLLSRQLYDSLRKLGQDDASARKALQQELADSGLLTNGVYQQLQETSGEQGGRALDLTRTLVREGYLPQAAQAEQRARAGIDELRRGVERATESVIGDDTEALRLAKSELDAVTEQLQREAGAAATGEQPTEDRAKGNSPGDQKTDRAQNGKNADGAAKQGEGARLAADEPPQDGYRDGAGERPGSSTRDGNQRGDRAGSRAPGNRGGENGGGALSVDNFLRGGEGPGAPSEGSGPIMGGNFAPWADRLRDVEEVLDQPELRTAVATARERARIARLEYKRDAKKPDWAVVQLEVLKPLLEVRSRLADELSRRESKDSLVPIDRDPVPSRYAESVRKYYEELGKDKPAEKKP
jgi:hypothetical protein